MTIATLHRVFSRTVLLLGFTALVACGGGGGGGDNTTASRSSNSTAGTSSAGISSSVGVSSLAPSSSSASSIPLPDTIPNSFSFNSVTGVELSAVTPSEAVTISGINTLTTVSVTGGEYSIDGAAFTAIDGQVSNGQTLAVRLTASAVHSTTSSATVTVGGVSASFSVTTKADTTPEAFSFEPVTDAALNTVYTSGAITITGIDAAVPITVTGGEYAINSEETFTSAAGTVSANNTVRLRGTSATGNDLTHAVVITIGGISATYSITTILDTTPPVAEFKFPTPYTMSEANTVKVRGTATDDNTITSVKVVVRSYNLATPDEMTTPIVLDVTPKAEIDGVKDFSSWTADIPLTALAENEIKVIATDENDNTIPNEDANKVIIRQADVLSAFPDEVNQFDYAVSLVFDTYDGRNRALVASSSGGDRNVIAVDLATGRRSIAFTSPDCSLYGLTIDPLSKHIFGVCSSNLYEFNLSDGSLIGTYRVEGSVTTIPAIVLDRNNGRNRLVLLERKESESSGSVFSFELDTKTFSTISAVDQLPPFRFGESILLDGDNYLVPGSDSSSDFGGQIISVSALDGARKIISDNTIGIGDLYGGSGFWDTPWLSTMVKHPNTNKFFVFEIWSSRIFTLDQETMNRKLFSNILYAQQGIDRNYVIAIDMEIDGDQGHLYIADNQRRSIIVVDTETGAKVILSKSKNNR